jgi:hypothetical protein
MGAVRFLPVIVEIGLLVYCLIDCVQSPEGDVRNLPKTVWIFLIILLPIVGSVTWLVAGRPQTTGRRPVPWPSTQTAGFPEFERPKPPRGPDDDPAFLARLGSPDPEREHLLAEWESQLRAREERLRRAEGQPDDDGAPATEPPPT